MWVKINTRTLVNVSSKVTKIIKEDIPLSQGSTGYYISFYETMDEKSKDKQQLRFNLPSDRDEAFDTINKELEIIDITTRK